jgi:NADPH:quinone reductase-like Zn-dependent oxidoreductase
MKAATIRRYGGPEVVRIEDLPVPVAGPGEVRVRITAAAVTAADARLRANDAPRGFGFLMRCITGLIRPRHPVFGMEFAGVVDALGAGAAGFTLGQRVFGITGIKGGAHAEYLTIRADASLFALPDTLDDAQGAAFFFGGLTAADFLMDKADIRQGDALLINGATGSVGSAAIQIGRHLGAKVTAVARAENHAFAHELGAGDTVDYRAGPISGQWDVILDVVGSLPYAKAAPLLAPGGRLLRVTATLAEQLSYGLRAKRGAHRIIGGVVGDGKPAMERLIRLHSAGAYRPTVGNVLPFSEIAAAHARAGSRHKRGNTVVLITR